MLKVKLLSLFIILSAILTTQIVSPGIRAYAYTSSGTSVNSVDNDTLNVIGNKVFATNQKQYIPEGISVYGGLEQKNYSVNVKNVDAQIQAAAKYWHANTIRLQIAESNLFRNLKRGQIYNPVFLKAIVSQVNLAHEFNMAVVLNDQTEFTSKTVDPTATTVKFWKIMSSKFNNKPYVIFDLFNEPRLGVKIGIKKNYQNQTLLDSLNTLDPSNSDRPKQKSPITQAEIWKVWKYGGRVGDVKYIGMQSLVNQIRGYGARNLIWIEGPDEAKELPDNRYLLTGNNLVYSIHHPNLNNPFSWDDIGNLSKYVPVVDGEWAQYQSPWAECYKEAYTNVPLYLNYLKAHQVGVIAWSLQAGSLLANKNHVVPTNLGTKHDPTNLKQLSDPSKLLRNYTCSISYDQGVGQIIKSYFAKNSSNFSEPKSNI